MSRTVRVSCQRLPASILFVLLVMAASLSVHFLVEDLVYLPGQPGSVSSMESLDELTHQDDVVLSFSLPAWNSISRPSVVTPAILLSQTQAFFPFRHPPKI